MSKPLVLRRITARYRGRPVSWLWYRRPDGGHGYLRTTDHDHPEYAEAREMLRQPHKMLPQEDQGDFQ